MIGPPLLAFQTGDFGYNFTFTYGLGFSVQRKADGHYHLYVYSFAILHARFEVGQVADHCLGCIIKHLVLGSFAVNGYAYFLRH